MFNRWPHRTACHVRHSEVQADSGKRHMAGTDGAAQIAAEKDEALTACALPHVSGSNDP